MWNRCNVGAESFSLLVGIPRGRLTFNLSRIERVAGTHPHARRVTDADSKREDHPAEGAQQVFPPAFLLTHNNNFNPLVIIKKGGEIRCSSEVS